MECTSKRSPIPPPPPPVEVTLTLNRQEAEDLLRIVAHLTVKGTDTPQRNVRLHYELYNALRKEGLSPSHDFTVASSS